VIDGKAVKTVVTLGKKDIENVIVEKGISVGDVIVVAGQLKIHQDNSPVIDKSAAAPAK
jgi:hypothetical protein